MIAINFKLWRPTLSLRTLFAVWTMMYLVLTARCVAELPEIEQLRVHPKTVLLKGRRSTQQLLVFGVDAQQREFDLTRSATLETKSKAVKVNSTGTIQATGNGDGQITIRFGEHRVEVPVQVRDFDKPDPVRFETETVAVLTKHGCNAGSCHGSPKGKGGFSLSLFAYDPQMDRRALLFAGFNRRINTLDPDQSLVLKKPMLQMSHVGGKRLRKSDPGYKTLHTWIYEGAHADLTTPVRCTKLEVAPHDRRELHFLESRQNDRKVPRQQLSVTATFSDGSRRDVTSLASFDTTDKDVVQVDSAGLVSAGQRGQAAITVRYLEHFTSIYFTVVEPIAGFVWQDVSEHNFIDQLVNKQLRKLSYAPAGTCNDATFVRRIHLDLTGLLPTAEAARAFLHDSRKDKRARLIDELLKSDAFSRFWALKLADLLRINSSTLKDGRAEQFAMWLRKAIQRGVPYDQLARDILLARGSLKRSPQASYFLAFPTMEERTETTAQVFMGTRIQCAKCHNHPFENWTQTDYYRIGAVFHHVSATPQTVEIMGNGELKHPTTGKELSPWGQDQPSTTKDRRKEFVRWLVSKENPYFARVAANRIWANLFGYGIVDPVDDFRSSNPPSNVELLDRLATELHSKAFDQRHLIRLICNSQTYQRTTKPQGEASQDAVRFGASYPIRLLTAEQVQDAIGMLTRRLAPVAQIEKQENELRQKRSIRQQELDNDFSQWKAARQKLLTKSPVVLGTIWQSKMFTSGDFKKTVAQEFLTPDGIKQTDSKSLLEIPGWTARRGWDPGPSIKLPNPQNTACYVMLRIHVLDNQDHSISFRLRGDDDVQAWLRGQSVASETRHVQVTNTLKPGVNRLILKVTNQGGDCTWQLNELKIDDAPLPAHATNWTAEVLAVGSKYPTEQARATHLLRQFQADRDTALQNLDRAIDKLQSRSDYATQRALPEQTAFLKAFGQPGRESPCVCERSSEPTLEQALQLLNGTTVLNWVNQSPNHFQKLTDKAIVERLYLGAVSRLPDKSQMQVALKHLAQSKSRDSAIADLVWALINTQEFLFQH